jgi:hypothetical protein
MYASWKSYMIWGEMVVFKGRGTEHKPLLKIKCSTFSEAMSYEMLL